MNKKRLFTLLIVLLTSCQNYPGVDVPDARSTHPAAAVEPSWNVYDPAWDHPWNRLFRQLYRRTGSDGQEYGKGELDPLLWFDTTYLLAGSSHSETLQVLDEYLSSDAHALIQDPLQRALFQRDLWAVFDWAASQSEPYPREREALTIRLAEIIKRVALTKEEILALPDNYELVLKSAAYPAVFQKDMPETAFLPNVFQPDSAWIAVGREGGPTAFTHTAAFPFFGRSAFFVFIRSPDGREGTLELIDSLNREPNPITPIGAQVALVRRMLLIDKRGELVLSPIVETVQLRHFGPAQSFYEFELDRKRLFGGTGGLVPNYDLIMLFMSHGDVFENPRPDVQVAIPQICTACHFETPPIFDSGATRSIISYSREPFPLPGNARPVLFSSTVEEEAQTVIAWKQHDETWRALKSLWNPSTP